jgi:hypothetical protein
VGGEFDPIDTGFQPLPPPAELEAGRIKHPKLGKPSLIWAYHTTAGQLDGYVCRFETRARDGKADKEFRPYRYGTMNGGERAGWYWKGWGPGRPLYHLPELLARPSSPVIVTEGEKKADTAERVFPDYVAVSPMNGARSPHKTDWSVVAGRSLVIWPDNDVVGRKFAETSAQLARAAGAAEVAIVAVPQAFPEKWDLANDAPAGIDLRGLLDQARAKAPVVSEAAIAAEVQRLAGTSVIGFELEREAAAEKLGIRVGVLERLVKGEREEDQRPGHGRPVSIPEVEPWPEPVAGAALLDEMATAIRSYVVLLACQADAVALWVIYTHAFEAFDFSTRLIVDSPEMRSGKTRLVEVVERMVRRPLSVSGISPSALLRVIEQYAPAMLLDEIDALMQGNAEMAEALRGLINSGFNRGLARHVKNVPTAGGGYEPREFSMWCPLLLAGIGKLANTIADRSIIITMARKRPDEKVRRLRARDGGDLRELGRKAARWVADNFAALQQADPEAPQQLNDRAADGWSLLLAIADLAGGSWPERARRAARELTGDQDTQTVREMLLSDLRELFDPEKPDDKKKTEVLFTKDILAELHRDETRPWPEWRNGKPITDRQLAAQLKAFGIKPKTFRREGKVWRGYELAQFDDAFARYLPLRSATPLQTSVSAGLETFLSATPNADVADEKRENPSVSAECCGVADRNPQMGRDADSEAPSSDPEDTTWTE